MLCLVFCFVGRVSFVCSFVCFSFVCVSCVRFVLFCLIVHGCFRSFVCFRLFRFCVCLVYRLCRGVIFAWVVCGLVMDRFFIDVGSFRMMC